MTRTSALRSAHRRSIDGGAGGAGFPQGARSVPSAVRPKIVEELGLGRLLLELRQEHGAHGYLERAHEDPRFSGLSTRQLDHYRAFATACARFGITESVLAGHPQIRLSAVRSRLSELEPPRKRALAMMEEWSSGTATSARHAARKADHIQYNHGAAAVLTQTSPGWRLTLALERGRGNFDWRILRGLSIDQALGVLAGQAGTATELLLRIPAAARRHLGSLQGLTDQFGTTVVPVAPTNAWTTPASALAALGVQGAPSAEGVCLGAGWRLPADAEARKRGSDLEAAICLLAHAKRRPGRPGQRG